METIVDSNENFKDDKTGELKLESSKTVCNEADEWIDIIGSGGLKKRVLREGICETRPTKGDTVKIKAVGRLEDGTQIETMEDYEFTIGEGEVIHGLDMIVPLMDKGEESEVFMEARFAFGEKGLEPNVPPNANLYFTILLIDFRPEQDPETLEIEQRLRIGIRKRERGNWWYKREDNRQAILCYKSAVDFLDDTSDTYGEQLSSGLREILEERLKTLNNMAAAQIKVEAYDVALKSVDSILKCQPDNLKALFRKGKVLGLQGDYKEALEYLNKAITIDPDSKVILAELVKVREKAKMEAESEKSLYRKMLGLKPGEKSKKEKDRHPTLRGFPLKLWASIFVILLSIMVAYTNKDAIFSMW